MVKVFLFPFFLLGTSCIGQTSNKMTADHIRIAHVGPIDKPIFPLVISTTYIELPIGESLMKVDSRTFELCVQYLEDSRSLTDEKKVNEFGVFKITATIGGKAKTYFTVGRNESIDFFKSLISQIEKTGSSEELTEAIQRLLARIDLKAK